MRLTARALENSQILISAQKGSIANIIANSNNKQTCSCLEFYSDLPDTYSSAQHASFTHKLSNYSHGVSVYELETAAWTAVGVAESRGRDPERQRQV